ncbi:MAG: Uma2 family endonuclease [Bacteroidota bacterium]
MGEKALATYSYKEYLVLEASSEQKYEYHGGLIAAMAGGTLAHGQLATNFGKLVGNEIDKVDISCNTYSSDVKVRIESADRTFYPDFSVVCGEPQTSEKDPNALINPLLIVEVLSESTVAFDRGAKFSHYRQIQTLKEYVLISQSEPLVDVYYRTENGTWDINTYMELSESIHLKSLECAIQMEGVYRRVPGIGD